MAEKKFIETVGRRKLAVARVRLMPKGESFMVNEKLVGEYFSGKNAEISYMKPFVVTQTTGKFGVSVKVTGSGKSGQLGAMIQGIARALDEYNHEEFHKPLKVAGLLTRDSRMKESKKVGLMGARRGKQSPKR